MVWPLVFLIALVLDLLLKDPPGWPHPVRWVGYALCRLESLARHQYIPLHLFGCICVALMAACAWFFVAFLSSLPWVGWVFAVYFSYAGLALGGLLQEGHRVAALLRLGRIGQARTALAGLVSRDVTNLDEEALRRALAETISENFNDAFIAPFFYLLLFGPPGLWVYKTISTMDSMWGYHTAQWKELGWAAARTDDLLAFIPARLSAIVLLCCARLMRFPRIPGWRELKHQAAKTESPNAGWPMAAAALCLNAGMGGPTPYFGRIKDKPWIGPRANAWEDQAIARLLRLIRTAGLVFALTGLLFYVILI
jgi:adenosylcobinamide-phosphate synthase